MPRNPSESGHSCRFAFTVFPHQRLRIRKRKRRFRLNPQSTGPTFGSRNFGPVLILRPGPYCFRTLARNYPGPTGAFAGNFRLIRPL